ncbi:kinase-like domain-containing protein, partial [Mycena olivaceomarginata]
READVWSKLKHRHLVPFIGLCEDIALAPAPVLISPFYKFGNIATYLKKNPSADRIELIREVASGLSFLHDRYIVHGDVKPVRNVLVDKHGAACICDFGLSKVINCAGFSTSRRAGRLLYMAPELLANEGLLPTTTKESDVYSFGLVVLEILTSQALKHRSTSHLVTSTVFENIRPKRADYDMKNISNSLWELLDRCWTPQPELRSKIHEVLRSIQRLGDPSTHNPTVVVRKERRSKSASVASRRRGRSESENEDESDDDSDADC